MVNTYVPTEKRFQKRFLNIVGQKNLDFPNKNNIIWGGDFNFEEHDKIESTKRFNKIKDILNLETTKDILSERSPKFTFRHKNYKILNNKRLDRF